jgi:hypothetical protein
LYSPRVGEVTKITCKNLGLLWTPLEETSGFFSPCSKSDKNYIFGSGVDIEIKVCGMLTF